MPGLENTTATLLLAAAIGYGLGSILFGLIVTRMMNLGDLRAIGSGNIGATNVLRTGNKLAAALTLVLDGGKGAVAILLARAMVGEDAAQIAALAAFLGHCFPIWRKFKGGKGVATFIGLWLALDWRVGLACCATWLVAAVATRMSSMGALVAVVASTVWIVMFTDGSAFFLGVFLTIVVFLCHHENIARIRSGTEPKIGQKS
ncbi:MAG: glycerol-3-phosphate 1-O-acyltransferase PlsY [Rhodobacteraceae bacterium]|nr:glycerol-3-phosphate 1-O-acyltransferase PlsY [Paracoccaceae bacterium]